MQRTIEDIQRDLKLSSNLLLVTNKSGAVLAVFGASPRAADVVAHQPAIRDALAGHESVSLLPQPNGMLQLVTVPIAIGLTHPEILGTLSVGFLLDDVVAAQLKAITGSDVAFGMDGQILATTLPPEHRGAWRRCCISRTASTTCASAPRTTSCWRARSRPPATRPGRSRARWR